MNSKSKKKKKYTRIYSMQATGRYYYGRIPKFLPKGGKIERNKYDSKLMKHVKFLSR